MKKPSKISFTVLIVALLILMTACTGSNDKPTETTTAEAASETTAADTTVETTEETTAATTEESTATTAETTDQEETTDESVTALSDFSIVETVLFEQNDVKVTALKAVTDDLWGSGIKVLIENNSEKDILLTCNSLSVNDYMIFDLFSAEVTAGKKSNQVIYITDETLLEAGLREVADIDIIFDVSDNNNYETIFITDPIKLKTEQADSIKKEKYDDGLLLLEQDGIKIVAKYLAEDEFYGKELVFYFENNSGKEVAVYCESLAINGFMIDPYFGGTIRDGKILIEGVSVSEDSLKSNDIKEIKEVDIKFSFNDTDSYDTILETEELSFTIE